MHETIVDVVTRMMVKFEQAAIRITAADWHTLILDLPAPILLFDHASLRRSSPDDVLSSPYTSSRDDFTATRMDRRTIRTERRVEGVRSGRETDRQRKRPMGCTCTCRIQPQCSMHARRCMYPLRDR